MLDDEDNIVGIGAREMSILLGITEEMVAEDRERQWLLKQVQSEEDEEPQRKE